MNPLECFSTSGHQHHLHLHQHQQTSHLSPSSVHHHPHHPQASLSITTNDYYQPQLYGGSLSATQRRSCSLDIEKSPRLTPNRWRQQEPSLTQTETHLSPSSLSVLTSTSGALEDSVFGAGDSCSSLWNDDDELDEDDDLDAQIKEESLDYLKECKIFGSEVAGRFQTEIGTEEGQGKLKKKREKKRKTSKSSYKHVPHREKPVHLVARRNARERKRVQAVNSAFVRLRKVVPVENRGKRLSKVKTLHRAIEYIDELTRILEEEEVSKNVADQVGQTDKAPPAANGDKRAAVDHFFESPNIFSPSEFHHPSHHHHHHQLQHLAPNFAPLMTSSSGALLSVNEPSLNTFSPHQL